MKVKQLLKMTVLAVGFAGLAACSSTRSGAGAPVTDADAAGGAGAYAQGAGGYGAYGNGSGGAGGTANCHPPASASQSSYFDYDKSDVSPEAITALQALAPKIASGNQKVDVVGNTDDRGSREYNLALGTRRANSIASILEQNGVSKSQIIIDSNGAEYPIATGNTDNDYQCNRRTDVCFGTCKHD